MAKEEESAKRHHNGKVFDLKTELATLEFRSGPLVPLGGRYRKAEDADPFERYRIKQNFKSRYFELLHQRCAMSGSKCGCVPRRSSVISSAQPKERLSKRCRKLTQAPWGTGHVLVMNRQLKFL